MGSMGMGCFTHFSCFRYLDDHGLNRQFGPGFYHCPNHLWTKRETAFHHADCYVHSWSFVDHCFCEQEHLKQVRGKAWSRATALCVHRLASRHVAQGKHRLENPIYKVPPDNRDTDNQRARQNITASTLTLVFLPALSLGDVRNRRKRGRLLQTRGARPGPTKRT